MEGCTLSSMAAVGMREECERNISMEFELPLRMGKVHFGQEGIGRNPKLN